MRASLAIAVEGEIFDNLRFARDVVKHGKHVWLDKPAGDMTSPNLQEVLDIALAAQAECPARAICTATTPASASSWTGQRLGGSAISSPFAAACPPAPGSADRWKLWESPGVRAGGDHLHPWAGTLVDIIVSILGTAAASDPVSAARC